MKTCEVYDCDRLAFCRGWCRRHYDRWRRRGDPLAAPLSADDGAPLRWLIDAIQWRDRDQCWDWPFATFNKGQRGWVSFEGGMAASSAALILDGQPRPAPPMHHGIHSCDRPICCNPAHVRWGSNADNVADAVARGRNLRGERQNGARLTEDGVRSIRARFVKGRPHHPNGSVALAAEFGVSEEAIRHVVSGRTWTFVK